jgi:hypothetical protein
MGDETATAEITGGTFLYDVVIGQSAGGASASIKGGTFNGGFVFYSRGSSLEFYGDLVLTLLWSNSDYGASLDITGTLRDGTSLDTNIECIGTFVKGTEEEPCLGLTIAP